MENVKKGILKDPVQNMKKALRFTKKHDQYGNILRNVFLLGDYVLASDGYRIHADFTAYEGDTMVLPESIARDISKYWEKPESCEITQTEFSVIAEMPDGKTFSAERVHFNRLPAFETFLSDAKGSTLKSVLVERRHLLGCVRKCVKAKDEQVNVTCYANKVNVFSENAHSQFVDGEGNPDFEKFGATLNAKFLRDALNSMGGTKALIASGGNNKPVHLLSMQDDGLSPAQIEVIMPIRTGKPKPEPKPDTVVVAKASGGEHVKVAEVAHDDISKPEQPKQEEPKPKKAAAKHKPEKAAAKPKPKAKPKAEPKAKPQPVEDAVAEVTVETLKEATKGWGVAVTQKNERSCIWVSGNTKPHKDELREMGLQWSGKRKAWYKRVS